MTSQAQARRRIAMAVGAFVVFSACGATSEQRPQAQQTDLTLPGVSQAEPLPVATTVPGDRLPQANIVGLGDPDDVMSLVDIEGPAVINLWATWCAPCRAEIPDFEEVHQTRGHEVRFVGINVGEDADVALGFLDEIGVTYDQFRDPDGSVSTGLIATSMPTTVVIDANGVITERHRGPLNQDGLNEAIDEALGITEG